MHINTEQRITEVERFYYKLQEILNHQLNDRLNETVEVIMYNGKFIFFTYIKSYWWRS